MNIKRPSDLQKEIAQIMTDIQKIAKRSRDFGTSTEVTAKFAELLVSLSELAEISTRRLVHLSWALFGLTAILLLVSIVQLMK
jgi:hypothetical protein